MPLVQIVYGGAIYGESCKLCLSEQIFVAAIKY